MLIIRECVDQRGWRLISLLKDNGHGMWAAGLLKKMGMACTPQNIFHLTHVTVNKLQFWKHHKKNLWEGRVKTICLLPPRHRYGRRSLSRTLSLFRILSQRINVFLYHSHFHLTVFYISFSYSRRSETVFPSKQFFQANSLLSLFANLPTASNLPFLCYQFSELNASEYNFRTASKRTRAFYLEGCVI